MPQLLTPEQIAQNATLYLQQAMDNPDWTKIEQYLTELFLSQSRSAYELSIQAAQSHQATVSSSMFAMAHRERDYVIEDIVQSIKALKQKC